MALITITAMIPPDDPLGATIGPSAILLDLLFYAVELLLDILFYVEELLLDTLFYVEELLIVMLELFLFKELKNVLMSL